MSTYSRPLQGCYPQAQVLELLNSSATSVTSCFLSNGLWIPMIIHCIIVNTFCIVC